MTEVNASPVPALIDMFIWEKAFIKAYSDGTPSKYYFLRQDGNKLHTVYSHPEDHSVLVYYVKDCGDSTGVSNLFKANQKKRLENDYVIFKGDTTITDAVTENYSFYTA